LRLVISGFANQEFRPLPKIRLAGTVEGSEGGMAFLVKNELTGTRTYGLSTFSDIHGEKVVRVPQTIRN